MFLFWFAARARPVVHLIASARSRAVENTAGNFFSFFFLRDTCAFLSCLDSADASTLPPAGPLASNSAAASTLPPAGPLASNSAAASVSANQAAFTRNDFAQILSPAAIEQVTETLACGQHPTCDQMIRVNLLTDEAFERILHGLSTLKRPLELYWPKCVALLQAESRLVRYGINGHRRVDVFWIVEHLFLEKVHRSKLDLLKSHTIQVFPDIRSPKQRQETILLTALLIGRDPDFFALASVSTVDVSRVGILTDSNKARLGRILSDGGALETMIKVNSIPHEALEEAVARLFQCSDLHAIWPGYVKLLDVLPSEVFALIEQHMYGDIEHEALYVIGVSIRNAFPGEQDEQIISTGIFMATLLIGMSWIPAVSPAAAAAPGEKKKTRSSLYVRPFHLLMHFFFQTT